jgi:hypothetical protein
VLRFRGRQGHVIQLQGDQRKNVSTFLIAVRDLAGSWLACRSRCCFCGV